MSFAWPWAFAGLLSFPVLALIYWLRQRAPRQLVSSLLLWSEESESRSSGRRFERFEASRLFLLELLILLLLVLAAAGPEVPTKQVSRPLVVVLDDSFSMLAGGDRSPRNAARDALLRELGEGAHSSLTLVLAGEQPQVLDEGSADAADAATRLEQWRARAPVARIDLAVALAFDLAGERARILVLSDHAPPTPVEEGRLVWRTFGAAVPNLALVNAVRGSGDGGAQTYMVEVANFSEKSTSAQLAVGEGSAEQHQALDLAAGELGRWRFRVPEDMTAELRVSSSGLTPDGLSLDNNAILLPENDRSVRVALEIEDAALRDLIVGALQATGRAVLARERPELVISDSSRKVDGAADSWTLRVIGGAGATAYLGPFILDHSHPLSSGLNLDGVIWGAARSPASHEDAESKTPVITAGDLILVTDRETVAGLHHLVLMWSHGHSTLQRTPNWPILWLNLLEWRARSVPGVRQASLRLGSWLEIGLEAGTEAAELELPDGTRRRLLARGGSLRLRADEVGIHRLRHGGRTDRWVVNALAAGESDLRQATTGQWGSWRSAETRWERRSVAWAPLLLGVACLMLHLWWIQTRKGRSA